MTRENRRKQRNIPEKRAEDDSRNDSVNKVRAAERIIEVYPGSKVRAVRTQKKTIFTHPLPLHHSRYLAERNYDVETVDSISEIPENQLLLAVSGEPKTFDYFDEIYRHISFYFPGKKGSIFAHYNPLVSVPQSGNTCGFVALSMASQMFHPVGAKRLFEEAKRQRRTVIGEMFDAYDMANFASEQLDCDAKVICNLNYKKYDMLSHICDGWPVLIAYDHFAGYPAVSYGEKAHWAVLNGLFFNVSLTVDAGRQLRMISTTKGDRVKERLRLLFDCSQSSREFEIFVLAREGLTKQLLAWHLDALLTSNCNLWLCTRKFGLPKDYELFNLRDKAVLLMGKK